MRLPKFRPTLTPQVPGPGREKIRGPRRTARVWLLIGALALLIVVLGRPLGIDAMADAMRREFVALRHVQSASAALSAKPLDRAAVVRTLDRAVLIAPHNHAVQQRAGILYMYVGAYQKAAAFLAGLPDRDMLMQISLGHSLLLSGKTEQGLEILHKAAQQARARRQDGTIGVFHYALYLNNIGYALAEANVDLARAHALIAEAMRIHPLQPAFIDSLGWCYYRTGDYRQAMFYLERAARLGGPTTSAETHYHLGATYARMGRIRLAALALAKALEYDPQYEEAAAELRQLNYFLPRPVRA
jgi:tetratricopeptide (TPR) repeat protein